MKEDLFDALERMETLVPDYSYESVEKMTETDMKIKDYLLSQMKAVKDYMFHVVQVSYELQRDRLSGAAEPMWDEVMTLMTRVQTCRTCKKKSNKSCDECLERAENNLRELIRKDREIVLAVKEMKRSAHGLYRALLDSGRERYFIKNLGKIKNYAKEITELLDERDALIKVGG